MTVHSPSPAELLQLAQQLPASTQILLKISMLVDDLNCTLEELAQHIRRDATLAARVIRISNSAAYGGESPVGSVEEAVGRVGFSEVHRLTGLAVAAQLGDEHLPFYGHNGAQLRDNTLLTALVVEELARHARQDPRTAYAAALLRSMGKLVLDRYVKKHLSPMQHYSRSGVPTLLTWEENILHCENASVAATILESWHFPPAITEPVKHQYHPERADDAYRQTALLLNIASGIAADLGFSLPGESNYWEPTPEKISTAGLSGVDLASAGEKAAEALAAIRDSL